VPGWLLIGVKAADGGLFVAAFAVLGELLQPKRFAGIFGASPAVALANLLAIALIEGDTSARSAAGGMVIGAVAFVVACLAAIPAVRRWGAVRGSAILWAVWLVAGAAIAVPVLGAGGAAAGMGLPAGGPARHQETGNSPGPDRGRLFGIHFGAVRQIRLRVLVLRFIFGAAISIVAGLVALAAGKRAGGVMLGAPAVLPATLTIIEKREGRGPAVTEMQGAVPGTVALVGFAVVAAAGIKELPLAVSLLSALGAWTVVAIGGYLLQSALMPTWRRSVRNLAWERHAAVDSLARDGGRREVPGPPPRRPHRG